MSQSNLSSSTTVASQERMQSPKGQAAGSVAGDASIRTSALYEVGKRLFDLIFALVVLIPLTPVLLLLALLVKLEDRGPVFYRREVVGRNGMHFYALKFRTMITDADEYLATRPELLARYAAQVKLQDDPRITRLGRTLRRTSLDELPQLLNVLRGQMSLVGPRIIHPSELERFGEFASVRQLVRPGITGLWQVSGRQHVSYEQRVALDQEYMRRRSFWLDMCILAKTAAAVLDGEGAY